MKRWTYFVILLLFSPCQVDAALTLIGSCDTPGDARDVVVKDKYAFIADGLFGLRIVDITNPASPMLTNIYSGPAYNTRDIAIVGSYAYAAAAGAGLFVIDISDPLRFMLVGYYPTSRASGVDVIGSYAYIADGPSGLRIIDVSNPISPTEVGSYDTPGFSWDITVSGNYAYIADITSGMRIIDISNPYSPTEVGYYDTPIQAIDIAVVGNYAYVADDYGGLLIIDISNPLNPKKVGSIGLPPPFQALNVVVVGSYAYVAGFLSGLHIIDISDPTSPILAGSYDTPDSAWGVDVIGSYIYVADLNSGLQILADVTCIYGYLNDSSGNKLAGWTIFVDEDGDGILDAGEKNNTTDSDGHWRMCGLLAGDSVNVTEVIKAGWVPLNPASARQTITVQLENKTDPVNFTNIESKDLIEDLRVSKVAQVDGISVSQVNPGQTFNYNITITNKDLASDAQEVVVTDKLPYEAEYLGAEVYPTAPADYSINKSGDLIYVTFDQIPAASNRYINLTVRAPKNAPTTLYNIVNLRYRNEQNQSDNRMTLATYVPQLGYNQTLAAFSFEDLLHNQSQLLFQFEELLHTIPSNSSTNYSFLVSFEQLLRSQAALTSSFEDLLSNESSTGWDGEYSEENRTALLWSYEQMLYDEAFLFASFNAKLNESWTSLCGYTKTGHTQDAQTELIASFEDLLKRQARLYKSFNLLLNKIDSSSHQDMVDLLAAYENLLRVEANLLMSFNELLDVKYENSICP